MSTIQEIMRLEEELRLAELAPDPLFFERVLANEVLIDGQKVKAKVVEAHRPGGGQKFTKVKMSDFQIVDHGQAAVVTCVGTYEGTKWSGSLKFTRVWFKKENQWQIIAGMTSEL